MTRAFRIYALLAVSATMTPVVFADPWEDVQKIQTAFLKATSWRAEEHFPTGKTTIVEYVSPDRWRIQPTPEITELVIGNDVYMVRNGRSTKLPLGGGMIRKMIQDFAFSVNDEVRQSARDLGTQTLDGQSVHAYSYTARGVPVTIYANGDSLPVQSLVNDKKGTTTITYSKYNTPISIEP